MPLSLRCSNIEIGTLTLSILELEHSQRWLIRADNHKREAAIPHEPKSHRNNTLHAKNSRFATFIHLIPGKLWTEPKRFQYCQKKAKKQLTFRLLLAQVPRRPFIHRSVPWSCGCTQGFLICRGGVGVPTPEPWSWFLALLRVSLMWSINHYRSSTLRTFLWLTVRVCFVIWIVWCSGVIEERWGILGLEPLRSSFMSSDNHILVKSTLKEGKLSSSNLQFKI